MDIDSNINHNNNNSNQKLKTKKLVKLSDSVKGHTWGNIKISDNKNINFTSITNQDWFDIETDKVTNIMNPGKHEFGIEFKSPDESKDNGNDILCEMRFYVPPKNLEAEDEETIHSADKIKNKLNDITSSIGVHGETITVLKDIVMVTPRGKISVQVLKEIFKITGPSHDYKIPYVNISRAFMLPRQDGVHISFVIGLNTPMRQGSTSYPFIVFQFKSGEESTVQLTLPDDEKERKAFLKHPIDNELSGEMFDIMAKIFRSIIGVGVIIPGKFKR